MSRSMLGLHALVLYADFPATTPERAAFRAHLVHVATALREIERAEDGEPRPQDEAEAIRACLRSLVDPASQATNKADPSCNAPA